MAFSSSLKIDIFTFVDNINVYKREFDDHVFSSGDFEADKMHSNMLLDVA